MVNVVFNVQIKLVIFATRFSQMRCKNSICKLSQKYDIYPQKDEYSPTSLEGGADLADSATTSSQDAEVPPHMVKAYIL